LRHRDPGRTPACGRHVEMLKIEENQTWAVTTSDNQFQGLAGRSGLDLYYRIKKRNIPDKHLYDSPDSNLLLKSLYNPERRPSYLQQ